MANGTIATPFFKRETITATTDANGNIPLTTSGTVKSVVIFVWDGQYVFIPFYYGGAWYARVQSTASNAYAIVNTQLTVNVYYL